MQFVRTRTRDLRSARLSENCTKLLLAYFVLQSSMGKLAKSSGVICSLWIWDIV